MEHIFWPLGIGFAGLGLTGALLSVAYPLLVVWMIIDGFLRTDAEYPGTDPNRKVLWAVGMVLLHPVAIAYLVCVFMKVPRTRRAQQAAYTPAAPPAPPVPEPHA